MRWRSKQADPEMVADVKNRITKMFKALRKKGYFARQNFWCCSTCGWAAIPDGKDEKAVFYHAQDNSYLKESLGTYIAWSGDGKEIVQAAKDAGLVAVWNGSPDRKVWVGDESAEKPKE